MLCDKCGSNPATIQYVQVINGDKTELHLCKECASKMGIGNSSFDIPFSIPFNYSNVFNNFFENENRPVIDVKKSELECPNCGTKFSEFLKNGVIGCSECYKAFEKEFNKIIKGTHGTDKYIGKKYTRKSDEKLEEKAPKEELKTEENPKLEKLEELTRKLKEYINEENYEQAAEVRDQIKKLKEE